MQTTSQLWQRLAPLDSTLYETKVTIQASEGGTVDYTVFPSIPKIERFGMSTDRMIGSSLCSMLTVDILPASGHTIPKNAEIAVSIRAVDAQNPASKTEWLPMGTFYVSKREPDKRTGVMRLIALDSMRTADGDYTDSQSETYPMREMDAITIIQGNSRIASLASGLSSKLSNAAVVDSPLGIYKNREVMNYIAAIEGGNMVIRENGDLDFVPLASAGTPVASSVAQSVGNDGRQITVSGVTLVLDDGNYYSSGTESADLVTADCPYATQPRVNALGQRLIGTVYDPKTASVALLDPAVQVGDTVTVAGETFVLYNYTVYLGAKVYLDVQNPAGNEAEDEYPYADAQVRKFDRNFVENRTEIRKNAEAIEMIAVHNTATYRQGTIPENPTEGDIWYCTDDVSGAGVYRRLQVGDEIGADQVIDYTAENHGADPVYGVAEIVVDHGDGTARIFGDFVVSQTVSLQLGFTYTDGRYTYADVEDADTIAKADNLFSHYGSYLPKLGFKSIETWKEENGSFTLGDHSGTVLLLRENGFFSSGLFSTFPDLYEAGKWYRYNGSTWDLCEDSEFDDVWQSVAMLSVRADAIEQDVSGKVDGAEVESRILADLNGITLSTTSSSSSGSGNRAQIKLSNQDGTVEITGTVTMSSLNASTITAGSLDADLINAGTVKANYLKLGGDMTVFQGVNSNVAGGALGYTQSTLNGGAGMHVISQNGDSEIRITNSGCAMTTSGGEIYAGTTYAGVTGLTWSSGSDRDLKTGINYGMEHLDEFFDRLRPAEFEFRSRRGFKRLGLIAQDVQDALRESGLEGQRRFVGELPHIKTSPDDEKEFDLAIAYEEFIALCIRQIQELKRRVEDLEARQ